MGYRGIFFSFQFFKKNVKETKDKNLSKDIELLNAINADISKICKGELNGEAYKSAFDLCALYSNIYNRFGNVAKDKYKTIYTATNNELDKSRHSYLEKLSVKINNEISSGNLSEAQSLMADIYHFSDNEFKSKYLGMFSTSYKDYWEDKKEELQKTIKM
jgi:hypothetical protein